MIILPKPFSDRELLARIRAILRRTQTTSTPKAASDRIQYQDIEVYPWQTRSVLQWRDHRPHYYRIRSTKPLYPKPGASDNQRSVKFRCAW